LNFNAYFTFGIQIMKFLFRGFIFFFVSLQLAAKEKFVQYRAVECIGDKETISFDYCYVKAYSAKFITLNIGVHYLKTVYKPIHIQVIFSYRKGGVYQAVIDSKKIDYCSIMAGIGGNPILKAVTDDLTNAFPDFLHTCPYKNGIVHLQNITSNNANGFIRSVPKGFYKLNLTVFKYTRKIAQVIITSEFKENI
jgi:Protein of unknown function (DUF1091)